MIRQVVCLHSYYCCASFFFFCSGSRIIAQISFGAGLAMVRVCYFQGLHCSNLGFRLASWSEIPDVWRYFGIAAFCCFCQRVALAHVFRCFSVGFDIRISTSGFLDGWLSSARALLRTDMSWMSIHSWSITFGLVRRVTESSTRAVRSRLGHCVDP